MDDKRKRLVDFENDIVCRLMEKRNSLGLSDIIGAYYGYGKSERRGLVLVIEGSNIHPVIDIEKLYDGWWIDSIKPEAYDDILTVICSEIGKYVERQNEKVKGIESLESLLTGLGYENLLKRIEPVVPNYDNGMEQDSVTYITLRDDDNREIGFTINADGLIGETIKADIPLTLEVASFFRDLDKEAVKEGRADPKLTQFIVDVYKAAKENKPGFFKEHPCTAMDSLGISRKHRDMR